MKHLNATVEMQDSLAKKVFKESSVNDVADTIYLDEASCSNKINETFEVAAVSTIIQRPNKSVYDKCDHEEEEVFDADGTAAKNSTTFTLLVKAKSSKNSPKKSVVNRRTCHLAAEENEEDIQEPVKGIPEEQRITNRPQKKN